MSLPVGSAFNYGVAHAFGVLRSAMAWVAIAISGGIIVGIITVFTGNFDPQIQLPSNIFLTGAFYVLGAIAQLGIGQQAIRLSRPDFRLRPSTIATIVIYFSLVSAIFQFIPRLLGALAFWPVIKLTFVGPAFLTEEPELNIGGALAKSWRITTGAFWETAGFELLVILSLLIPYAAVYVLGRFTPIGLGGVATIPALLAVQCFNSAVYWIASIRFYDALVAHSMTRGPVRHFVGRTGI